MAHDIAWFRAQEERLKKLREAKEGKKPEQEKKVEVAPEEPKQEDILVKNSSDDDTYFKFHKNRNIKDNPHYFLTEELLIPRVNNCDTQRVNMFSNHINQFVHLKEPQFPRVFTNFEDQVGEYSVAYKKASESFEVIRKVVKNQFNYDLIVRYKGSGKYDIIHFNHAKNITEDYGYALNDCLPDVQPGDVVQKGDWLYKSDNYDDDGNFMYGRNLKAVYMPWKGLTYEDGVVISKSAAEKFTSYKVEKTMFSINGNDVLLNLYGDDKLYKSFPKVGDHIDSKVLVASRRKVKRSMLYDFQATKMREIDPVNDDVIYTGGGTVVDINIYNNIPLARLLEKKDEFNQEVAAVLSDQYRYWKELAEALEEIIPCRELTDAEAKAEKAEFGHIVKHPMSRVENPNNYTDEVDYYWKLAHENIDEDVKWRYDGKSFDNFKIEFIILKENPLTPGCKITGRYGNKGVITLIEDDDNMPTTEDGIKAELVLNPLGVINRLNPAQLQEVYLNFMADHVLKLMKETDNYNTKQELLLDFLKAVNKKQYDFIDIELITMNRSDREAFIDEVEREGIYIHQPPFFGNTTEEQFKKIFKEHPEWCTEYNFVGIEKPMTMGDIYMMRLKHESSNKMSMRSATNLNVKNLPAKSTLKKEKKILYSSTPIRMGEMEVTGLLTSKRPDLVEKLLKTYSTNETLRESTVQQLLSPGGNKDPLKMDIEADLSEKSISREILEKYLNVLGYTVVDNKN